jgi:UDP-2,3-diacylglucosamine hydrolase
MTTHTIIAPLDWATVDMASDLHLQASTAHTVAAWHHYLAHAECDALFILGDFFELWVGDDVLDTALSAALPPALQANAKLWQLCTAKLKAASNRMPIYMVVGNRDFLLGPAFYAASGIQPLGQETLLNWHSRRYLLAHGDQWCTDDQAYQAFRAEVRSPEWQQGFLAQPLEQRLQQAMAMRSQSSQRMQHMGNLNQLPDVSHPAVLASAQRHEAHSVIHGHTHTGQDHALSNGLHRHVLSDWDCEANPPRAQVLRLQRKSPGTTQRVVVRP